jgi:hypothetical protein
MINIETVEKNGQFCRRLSSAETAAPGGRVRRVTNLPFPPAFFSETAIYC